MHITKNTVVTMTFKVTDAQGKLLEDGKEPRAYLHGGYGNTLPRVEAELEGKEAGFQTTLTLAPEDAFGPPDEDLVPTMPKKGFPPGAAGHNTLIYSHHVDYIGDYSECKEKWRC